MDALLIMIFCRFMFQVLHIPHRAQPQAPQTGSDCGSSGSEVEDSYDLDYLPGSNELVELESASKVSRRWPAGDADELHQCVSALDGQGSFEIKCWECHFGRFALHKNSRSRFCEVYGHVRPDWASLAAAGSRPQPEHGPPSAAAGDGEVLRDSCAPALAKGGADTAPTVVSWSCTLCWKCSEARSHKGWRHCRQVLLHTAPDIKTWIAAQRRQGADAADGGGGTANVTAEAETCPGPNSSSPDCLGAEEPSQVVQLQQTTGRHGRPSFLPFTLCCHFASSPHACALHAGLSLSNRLAYHPALLLQWQPSPHTPVRQCGGWRQRGGWKALTCRGLSPHLPVPASTAASRQARLG